MRGIAADILPKRLVYPTNDLNSVAMRTLSSVLSCVFLCISSLQATEGIVSRDAKIGDVQLHYRVTTVLDECSICSAAVPGTATGLLFDEHVERVRALGSHGLGSNSPILARGGGDRGGFHRSYPCRRSTVRRAWRA